jgi:BirA family biotin operon repressor/biotin-[acetyl-CoA-carboxylase] ligase
MLSQAVVDRVTSTAGWPVPIRYVESTGSTNADLMAAGDEGAPEWSVLVAGHQTAGRGRMGRSWDAPPQSSLLVSVLLRPRMEPSSAPLLSLAAAVSMGLALSDARVSVAYEWPNDLMTQGERKIGGILTESRIEDGELLHVVIGVGLNMTQGVDDFPADLRLPATSLALEGATPAPETLLGPFLIRLEQRYGHGFHPDRVLTPYRLQCATIGRRVRATTLDGAIVEGTATDVDSTGALLLETADGEARVAFGEIGRLD